MTTPWVKSTYSAGNGACVEWRKSSYSADTANCVEWRKSDACAGDSCVEVAGCVCDPTNVLVQVRDSKDKDGPVLSFTPDEWKAFTAGVRAGEFDH